MWCLKCSGQAIDSEGFCYAHSSDISAKGSLVDRADMLRKELKERALLARLEEA